MSDRTVRIGGASGAWGDSPSGFEQLLGAGVDYFMMDYLAEVTMSLLGTRPPEGPASRISAGFRRLHEALPCRKSPSKAFASPPTPGGVNPAGCKHALEAVIAELGLSLRVAMVEGDDVMPFTDALRAGGPDGGGVGRPPCPSGC